jgi:hypothetical protein
MATTLIKALVSDSMEQAELLADMPMAVSPAKKHLLH